MNSLAMRELFSAWTSTEMTQKYVKVVVVISEMV